jgi:hypothetical protein
VLRHQRELNHNFNHTRHCLGSMPGYGRVDLEDAMIQAVEDTLYDGKIKYFRCYVERYGRDMGLPSDMREAILHNDRFAWFNVFVLGVSYRRLVHRWEYCANQLMCEYEIDPSEIPSGKACLDT